jgi:hypothetical protein
LLTAFLALTACGGDVTETSTPPGVTKLECPASTAEPVQIHLLENPPSTRALVATGGWVYYSVNSPAGGAATIRRVHRTGTSSEDVASGYSIATDGVDLFFKGDGLDVFARRLRGGNIRALPRIAGAGEVGGLDVGPPRGVLWTIAIGDTRSVARWDGAQTSILPIVCDNAHGCGLWWSADLNRVHWLRPISVDPPRHVLVSTPIEGGGGSITVGAELEGNLYVLGVDADNVYVAALGGSPAAPIRAIPKSGAPAIDLTEPLAELGHGRVDAGWVYFVDFASQFRLQRVRTSGGAVETVADHADGGIQAVAADECAVYWTAGRRLMRSVK